MAIKICGGNSHCACYKARLLMLNATRYASYQATRKCASIGKASDGMLVFSNEDWHLGLFKLSKNNPSYLSNEKPIEDLHLK